MSKTFEATNIHGILKIELTDDALSIRFVYDTGEKRELTFTFTDDSEQCMCIICQLERALEEDETPDVLQ